MIDIPRFSMIVSIWKGRRVWVGLEAKDDGRGGTNRRIAEGDAARIETELHAGREIHEALLSVLGECPARLMPIDSDAEPMHAPAHGRTLGGFVDWWLDHLADRERRSYRRKARSYLTNLVLPIVGREILLREISTATIKRLQDELLLRKVWNEQAEREVPIRVKTARNIVGYFRAAIIEAMERHGEPAADPFPAKLRWPKPPRRIAGRAGETDAKPDPFEREERDRVCEWYRRHKPYWYPWVFLHFWEGLRPSESAALRESDVDLARGSVSISKSRDEGEENDPKTRASRRTIRLLPGTVEVLRDFRPGKLHPKPDDYFFTGPKGGPVYTRDWPEDYGFYDVLGRLEIRQRKFYCTRHTSISYQLSMGANAWRVAKRHGTSLQMIEDHYGGYLPEADAIDPALLNPEQKAGKIGAKGETFK